MHRELSDGENQARATELAKLRRDIIDFDGDPDGVLPLPNHESELGKRVTSVEDLRLKNVLTKIIRGLEYHCKQRYVEGRYQVEIFIPAPQVEDLVDCEKVELGPGFSIQRKSSADDVLTVLYRIIVWNKLMFCALIDPTAAASPAGPISSSDE